jgi:hypothetical protein
MLFPYPTRMDGKRRTLARSAVEAGEGRSILPARTFRAVKEVPTKIRHYVVLLFKRISQGSTGCAESS